MNNVTSSTVFAAVAAASLCAAPAHAAIKYVAHRGDYADAPEGSMAAYRNAVERGSEIVKLDVRRSKDGVIVLSHDPSFRRTMGWDAEILDVTWEEIRSHVYLFKGQPTEERAVSLPEALEVVKAIPEFWIDFKNFTPEFCERVLAEFEKAGIGTERLMVATYSRNALPYMKTHHPEIRRVGHMDFQLQDGKWSPSFLRRKGVLYEPAAEGAPFAPEVADGILSYVKDMGLWGVNIVVNRDVVTPGLVEFLKEKGLFVSLALVHDAATARTFADRRPDCVVTRDRRTVKPIMDAALENTAAPVPRQASSAHPRRILCWGDSVTEGMAMPRGKDYPARLGALLGPGYEVFNSGDGGENTVTISARQGAVSLATAAPISFQAGERAVQIGDAADNGFRTPAGETIKLTLPLGRAISVNPVQIGPDSYTIALRDFRWNTPTTPITYTIWLERDEKSAAAAQTIPAGAAVMFSSAAAVPDAYCEIIFMGANGGWDRDVEKLIAQIRAMVARRGEDHPYLVIVPYWKSFPQEKKDVFKTAFGRHAVEFPAEPSLCYQNRWDVHLNENGYALLATLLHQRGAELGYWPL